MAVDRTPTAETAEDLLRPGKLDLGAPDCSSPAIHGLDLARRLGSHRAADTILTSRDWLEDCADGLHRCFDDSIGKQLLFRDSARTQATETRCMGAPFGPRLASLSETAPELTGRL